MTRIIVRQLPPTMNEEQFLEVVSPLPSNQEFYYVMGDLNLGEFAYSRAYIKFNNIDDMLMFTQKYDDYIFIDSKGNEYPALVEYAPIQKLPRRLNSMNVKKDTKVNTIENDPDFLAFKEFIENGGISSSTQQQTNSEQILEEIENKDSQSKDNKDTDHHPIPPLVEYLNKKRLEKIKIKDEKKRRKEEMKKKKKEEIRTKKLEKKKEKPQQQQQQPTKIMEKPIGGNRLTEQTKKDYQSDNKIDRKTVVIVSGANSKNSGNNRGGGSGINNERRKRQEKQQQQQRLPPPQESSSISNASGKLDSKKLLSSASSSANNNEIMDVPNSNLKNDGDNHNHNYHHRQQQPKQMKNPKEKFNDNNNGGGNSRKDDRQRIRNKDRPALEIYRPGVARQKSSPTSSSNQQNTDYDDNDGNQYKSPPKESTSISKSGTSTTTNQNYGGGDKPKYKYRVFTRTKINKPN
uniref:Regulator of nonsense transcripts 3A-like n=1 Tax=Dermatophagoides pteronyssinus TaxID=6956 RepID=A0A6P6YGV0_DERPT|nr:regulator of nonsense transcripts 3A-like [Dermatophagoides pteronyssinus]